MENRGEKIYVDFGISRFPPLSLTLSLFLLSSLIFAEKNFTTTMKQKEKKLINTFLSIVSLSRCVTQQLLSKEKTRISVKKKIEGKKPQTHTHAYLYTHTHFLIDSEK